MQTNTKKPDFLPFWKSRLNRLIITKNSDPISLVLPLLSFGAVQYIYIDLIRRKVRISFFLRLEMLNVLYIEDITWPRRGTKFLFEG